MRCSFLIALCLTTAAFANPQTTLEALTAGNSRDLSAWQALAAEAAAAGRDDIAEQARGQALAIEKQRFPCRFDERFRAFAFWIGDWDVHLANGTFAGTNSIQPAEQGCVLIEQWQSAGGGSGRSINYVDGSTGEWVQVWNDASGSQIDIRGHLGDEGMQLVGHIHYLGNGTTADFRGLWTPLQDGRVRQFFEQSTDGGESWTPWFEGFYSRRDSKD